MRQIVISVLVLFLFTGCSFNFWGIFDFFKSKKSIESSQYKQNIDYNFERSKVDREIRKFKNKYRGKLIDTKAYLIPPHNGYISKEYLSDIINIVKDSGVDFVIFTPNSFEGYHKFHQIGVKQKITLKEIGEGKVGLFFGGNYISHWLHRSHNIVNSAEEMHDVIVKVSNDIRSKKYLGVGEIGVYYFSKDKKIKYPFNKKEFLTIVDMVVKKELYININAQMIGLDGKSYERDVMEGIDLLYQKFPNIKLILSNNGMMSPQNIETLLDKYETLMISLKLTRQKRDWRYTEPILNSKGELYEDWADLLEDYSKRFLIASSSKFGSEDFRESHYTKEMRKYRRILGSIDEESAINISYKNAYMIFLSKK